MVVKVRVYERFETESGEGIFYSMAEIIRGRSVTTSVKRVEARKAPVNIALLNPEKYSLCFF